jgi:malonyl CoA-acyl carrier protein transacylase
MFSFKAYDPGKREFIDLKSDNSAVASSPEAQEVSVAPSSGVRQSEFPPNDEATIKKWVTEQTVRRVQWYERVCFLNERHGVKRWLGIGPGNVERNLIC